MAVFWIALIILGSTSSGSSPVPYYGINIGQLSSHFHDVKGDIFIVDDKTLFIKNFNYDGQSPDTYFWAGSSIRPDTSGFIVNYNKESSKSLKKIHNQDVILQLPDDMKIEDVRWLSVWSTKFRTSFGSIIFPKTLVPPRPVVIGPLHNTKKGVSSDNILILDSQTFLVPDFIYDGSGKDVYWWLSRGSKPNADGLQILEEDGRNLHETRTIVIRLPDGHSVFEYNTLSIWNVEDAQDYGFVEIPNHLNVPPSPRTLGLIPDAETNKMNCEMLSDNLDFQVRWLINRNDIILHLRANIENSEYMALGLSKDDTETKFDASDVVIAWIDSEGKGHAVDYFLQTTEKCTNGHGICPDVFYEGSKNNIELINATTIANTTTIVFKRPLKAEDQVYDQNIFTDGPQAVLWAIGPIHDGNIVEIPKFQSKGNLLLDFGRDPIWNCPQQKTSPIITTHVFEIRCPSDHIFRMQIGPSESCNEEKVWFINGLPAPELTVQRGQSYTFIVEGGNKPDKSHPFYITNSSEGGYLQNLSEGKQIFEEFFAGIVENENANSFSTVTGRLCEWTVSDPRDSITTLTAETTNPLTLFCEPGEFGNLTWIPDLHTPSTLYYQSFTQKSYGGKIKVIDFCEETNPRLYLENHNIPKTSARGYRSKPGLELENYLGEEQPKVDEKTIQIEENDKEENSETKEILYDKFLENNAYETSENNKPSIRYEEKKSTYNSNNTNDKMSKEENRIPVDENNITDLHTKVPQHFLADPMHPHDESERSDRNIPQQLTSKLDATIVTNDNRQKDYNLHEKLTPSQLYTSHTFPQNLGSTVTNQNSLFKPHFEGGFIPLVLNPVKERELTLPQFPPFQLHRSHKPFLFNESIPFHGTFKPGIPDFSGFNISSYSQEDSPYPLNYVQDNIPMLSAPKPQIIQNQISPLNLQAEFFRRQKLPIQHRHMFHYIPRPRNPSRQHVPALAPLMNIRIPNTREELDQVSSQRVQVAYQSTGKHTIPIQNRRRNQQVPNKIMHSPPIQRRPDVVNEGEAPLNIRPFKRPSVNYHREIPSSNFNKNIESPRISSELKISRTPNNNHNQFSSIKSSFNDQSDSGFRRVPPGLEKMSNDMIRNQQNTLNYQTNQGNPILSTISQSTEENLKSIEDEKKIHIENVAHRQKLQTPIPLFGVPGMLKLEHKHLHQQLFPANSQLFIQQSHPLPTYPFNEELQLKKDSISLNNLRHHNAQGLLPLHTATISPNSALNHTNENLNLLNKQITVLVNNSTSPNYQLNSSEISLPAFQSATQQIEVLDSNKNEKNRETLFKSKNNEKSDIINLSVSNDENEDLDLHLSDDSSVISYSDHDAPYGARLKPNNNRLKQKVTPSHIPKSPLNFLRKPQLSSSHEKYSEKNTSQFIFHSELSNAKRFPVNSNISNSIIKNNKKTNITTFPNTLETELLKNNSNESITNDTSLHFTLVPEYMSSYIYPGSKNILPSTVNYTYDNLSTKLPSDINLPHISEKPPSHDNGTDYSILNHVLFIIGGNPESGKLQQNFK